GRALHGREWWLKVFGPLALAAALFAPRALPPVEPAPPPRTQPLLLPAMHGLPPAKTVNHFELDAERSSVRFLVAGPQGDHWVECPDASGSMRLGVTGTDGELELHLPLASLRAMPSDPTPIDLPHLLGVHRAEEVVLRVALAATTTVDLPGVATRTWVGSLAFGARVRHQRLQTWSCALPGRPLRLQGHGTVQARDYGLPRRGLFSFLDASHDVTIGLDLAFRRRRDQ
ncbi:MAG: hypothetical protein JNK15_15240, partial [Planctomycetes bacterium]|nr:hypothetical protein [Planctomycetota bacterium]